MTDGKRPCAPVRQAYWLVIGALVLAATQAVAAAILLARFGAVHRAHGPWSVAEQAQADSVHARLAVAVVLGAGIAVLLAGAALAVPRRTTRTRAAVGGAAAFAGTALLLGVTLAADNAVLAAGAAELADLERLLPVWFSALSSGVVTGVVVLLGAALLRMGRDAAVEYYQHHRPPTRWRGFTSWHDIVNR
ncbi:hypothetical protein AB0J72_52400 [Dactylosporangium sp. NPDC049742]|uniref:hypothetical protein n=1 Tax=Dactylosporangium sp. NPDC049742 TaxID=3154737 RepID=UPI003413F655